MNILSSLRELPWDLQVFLILFCWFCFCFPKEKNISDQQNESSAVLKDQQVLDVKSYAHLFSKSVETLRLHLAEKGDGAELIWDKVGLPNT